MKIKLNQIELAFTEIGTGPPLLLVHGYPLSKEMWSPQWDALSRIRRILAPDLRGFGDSTPAPGVYSMDLFAADLNQFLDELSIQEPIAFCGLSMGGYIALAFARNYPERLHKLVLVSTRPSPDSPELRLGRDQAARTVIDQGIHAVTEAMIPKLLSHQTWQANPALIPVVREMMRPSLEGILGSLAGMRDRPDSRPFLAKIGSPTLVIHGADDQLIPLAEAEDMAGTIPGAQLAVIPAAGHLPNIEQHLQFNKVLTEFLLQ